MRLVLVIWILFGLASGKNCWAQTTVSQSFDGGTITPAGWTVAGGNSGSLFTVASGSNPTQSTHTGAGEIEWNSYNVVSGTEDLISPAINWANRGGSTPTVSFWFYRDGTAYNTSSYNTEGVTAYVNTSASVAGATTLGFVARRIGGSPVVGSSGWYQYTYNIPAGFNSCTNYIIFEFNSQDGDNCFMDDIQYITYPGVCYCSSSGGSVGDGITNVTFNTINNTSAANTTYTDYTGSVSTSVNVSASYNLTVKVNTAGAYTNYQTAWIDWNQNGVFTDPGESYNLGTATNVANGNSSACPLSITVPAGATAGTTRMRIQSKYNATSTSCETGFDGEVEDYAIIVVTCTNPAAPAAPTGTSSVCNTSTGIGYTVGAVAGATSYSWSYSGGGFSITSGSGTNSITASFASSASGNLVVYAINACGTGPASPALAITTNSSAPTTANAGPDQFVCGTSATLAGNAAAVGIGTWTILNPTGSPAVITTPSSNTSGVTAIPASSYVTLRWTISNGGCGTSYSDVVIHTQ